ncbi:hypothetical protein H8K35_08650 [Undibacterium sp. LX40W]|uniref:Uncharacterized protein n=1 Tax=Undibacterium nitidum TaxID=2762298 RepID=A0A923HPB1_9BURK|nr:MULTISPECIES: hypothetical protein [Undibacterium]MBC3881496.1 hypothetical protein [Undibacterium nitidum]MBC3891722.1 hypothetical protein [Undibacterium sp. LX40W]
MIKEFEDAPLLYREKGVVSTTSGRNGPDASTVDDKARLSGAFAGLTTIIKLTIGTGTYADNDDAARSLNITSHLKYAKLNLSDTLDRNIQAEACLSWPIKSVLVRYPKNTENSIRCFSGTPTSAAHYFCCEKSKSLMCLLKSSFNFFPFNNKHRMLGYSFLFDFL